MAEKILGLLSAFVLGGVAGFFYLVHCFKFIVEHNLFNFRGKLRSLLERYEPQIVALGDCLPLSPDRIEAVRAGYYAAQGLAGFAIELGMRAVAGRCVQCGSPEDVRLESDSVFAPKPLCRPCAKSTRVVWGA